MTDATKLPRHKFWGAGEPDCPQDLKGSNGELHTMRCKVCGDGWRKSIDVCFAALSARVPELTLQELDALGHAYFNGPLNSNEEMFGRAVERVVRQRLFANEGTLAGKQGGDGVPAPATLPRAAYDEAVEASRDGVALGEGGGNG